MISNYYSLPFLIVLLGIPVKFYIVNIVVHSLGVVSVETLTSHTT